MNRILRVTLVLLTAAVLVAAGSMAQEEEETKKKKKGGRKGARIGAVTGLALGALTGEGGYAVAGAAAGAIAGGAAGTWYEYDQGKQDDRTMMMADAISSNKSGDAPSDAKTGETVGDVGKRHMADMRGQWNIDIWVLGENGERILASGVAQGIAAGDNSTRILYRDLKAEGYDVTLDGQMVVSYDPGQGFFLENSFSHSDEVLKFAGEYLVDKNTYNYYLTSGADGEMISGGTVRSALRLELRISTPGLWVAEAFVLIDGKEVQVQSYRFTKS